MNATQEIKKILVLRNDHMGDLILSLPAITALKEGYPEAHLAVLIQDYTRDILWNNPAIDEIIIDTGQNVFELARQLRGKKFDLAVVLYPSWRNGWLCRLSRIPYRVGTGYKPVGILFNQRVYIHRTKVVHHEIDYCLKMAEAALLSPPRSGQLQSSRIFPSSEWTAAKQQGRVSPPGRGQLRSNRGGLSQPSVLESSLRRDIPLRIKDEDRLYAQSLLDKHNLPSTIPLIGIHPGSGGSALNLSKKSYAGLINGLSEKYKARIVLSGSAQEQGMIEEIISMTEAKPINLAGQTSLGQLMALFSLYSLFIGPSTGPMHLAAGLGIPVIALFPPLPSQSPAKWGPQGKGHVVLMPEGITCCQRRCKGEGCKDYNCMDRITAEQVLERIAAEEVLCL